MNLITEFFDEPGWDIALRLIVDRNSELGEAAATEELNRTILELARSDAARQIVDLYVDFIKANARRDIIAFRAFLRSGCPKLTREQLCVLGNVRDVSTAREFLQRQPSAWMLLLTQQVVTGDAFWQLLLASARMVKQGSRFHKPVKTTIVISHAGGLKRIFKLLPLSDGGFAATMPYHNKRSGLLMKMPRLRQTGLNEVAANQTMPFTVSDRVKLSYHADGFVQFSGETSSHVISGRDSDGTPRGLGLMSNSLSRPVTSGPSVGCSAWGLEEFESWVGKPSEAALVFTEEADFYVEPRNDYASTDRSDGSSLLFNLNVPGVHFSIFPFPAAILEEAIGSYGTGDEIEMRLPMNIYFREKTFRVKLVHMGEEIGLGIIANREFFGMSPSGFSISGPSDREHNMMAIYPALPFDKQTTSLDYHPESG